MSNKNADQFLVEFQRMIHKMENGSLKNQIKDSYEDLCEYAKTLESRIKNGLSVSGLNKPGSLADSKGEHPIITANDDELKRLYLEVEQYIDNLLEK